MNLPGEIVAKIFSFLPVSERSALWLLCKAFHRDDAGHLRLLTAEKFSKPLDSEVFLKIFGLEDIYGWLAKDIAHQAHDMEIPMQRLCWNLCNHTSGYGIVYMFSLFSGHWIDAHGYRLGAEPQEQQSMIDLYIVKKWRGIFHTTTIIVRSERTDSKIPSLGKFFMILSRASEDFASYLRSLPWV